MCIISQIVMIWLVMMASASSVFAIDIKVSQVTLTPPIASGNSFTTITFRQIYPTSPLVFVLPTEQGLDPASVRIKNITTTGFDVGVLEPSGSDGTHSGMTFNYIAISPGVHTLPDGTVIEAGSVNLLNTVQSGAGSVWSPVVFTNPFATVPTLQLQIQTANNEPSIMPGSLSVPWLTGTSQLVTMTGFQVGLERSETTAFGTISVTETVAYLAFPVQVGNFPDNSIATVAYQAGNSTNSIQGHDNGCFTTPFAAAYLVPPITVANKITRNGSDGGWLRRCSLTTVALGLLVDEDVAADTERAHIAETASFLSFSQAFDLLLAGGGIEAGAATTAATTSPIASWTHVTFPNAFSATPLVFALPDNSGLAPASLRIRNITVSGFDIASFEPLNESGAHASMLVSYVAITPGSHVLPNGDVFEAGSVLTSAEQYGTGNAGVSTWTALAFAQVHPIAPATLLQVQTTNNELTINPNNVSIPFQEVAANAITTTGMQLAIERAEAGGYVGPTVAESIAYLAVASSATGTLKDTAGVVVSYESILSASTIRGWDNGCYTTNYIGTYAVSPIVVGSQSTRNGGDGGWLRECSRSNLAIGVTVDEDRALNTERSHTSEAASFLVFDQAFEASIAPLLLITKTSSIPVASPLGVIGYTVTVENVGNSIATAVKLDDALSQYTGLIMDTYGVNTPFSFVDDALNPSGLTMGTPSYSSTGGAPYTYVPTTTGTDNGVSNWNVPMVGSMTTSGKFTLQYQVRVK